MLLRMRTYNATHLEVFTFSYEIPNVTTDLTIRRNDHYTCAKHIQVLEFKHMINTNTETFNIMKSDPLHEAASYNTHMYWLSGMYSIRFYLVAESTIKVIL